MIAIALLHHSAATAGAALTGSCATAQWTFYDGAKNACDRLDLSALPSATFCANDSWPEPYLVARPCGAADVATCAACGGGGGGRGNAAARSSLIQLGGRGTGGG